jgi:type 1 glutamine amidotransferase
VKRTIKRVVLWGLLLIVAFFAVSVARNWDLIQRLFLGGVKVYETQPPVLPTDLKRPAILVFSKTNAFRHEEAIPAANAMFSQLAKQKGWGYFQTENGAAFSPEILSHFDAVVFNNVSGDVFTPAQREAFKTWLENGGGYVGIHAAGDNSHEKWGWYMADLIGTTFTQHTMKPQFQQATVHVEDARHPVTQGLPASWQRTEEWYSFDKSPRAKGYGVLVTVDEKTYNPEGMFGKDLHMGDHPMVWWHCAGKGRVLYSAFGHRAEAYAEPEYKALLTSAVTWAAHQQGRECGAAPSSLIAENAR